MKATYILDYCSGDEVFDFFIVKSIAIRVDKNGADYLDVKLGDKTGEINGRKWSLTSKESEKFRSIKDGDIVKVDGEVSEFKSVNQIKIDRIRVCVDEDDFSLEDFIMKAPEDSEDMYSYIKSVVKSFEDKDFKNLCNRILDDSREKLMYYPAAKTFHHAVYGGLLYHIKRMIMSGLALCDIYEFLNRDLLITGIIIHDFEKLNELDANEMGIVSDYTFKGKMIGHLVEGAKTIDKLSIELDIPEEKSIMLQHMALSHHFQPEFGSPVKPLFPEAEMLHHIDNIDARMYSFEEALNSVERGSFTERLWTLDNRSVYRHKDWED